MQQQRMQCEAIKGKIFIEQLIAVSFPLPTNSNLCVYLFVCVGPCAASVRALCGRLLLLPLPLLAAVAVANVANVFGAIN